MDNYYVPEKLMRDWKNICKKYCEDRGYTLLFVNNSSFGYETKEGNLVHKYIDELKEEMEQCNLC